MPFGATGAWASDATGVAVLEIGLVVLASLLCGLAGVGLRRGWRALVGAPTAPSPLYYHLVGWGVLPLGDPAEARDVFLAVRAAMARAHSYSLFGAGVMLVLGALAYLVVGVVIGHLVPPSALLGGSGGGQTVLFVLALVGFVGGRLVGLKRLRDRPGQALSYGDLWPRRLRDYRSPLFLALSCLVVALQIAVTLLGAPHRTGTPVLDRGLPLDLCAVAMILTVVAGEALLGHVVHEPRVLLVADPLTAQRADDLLRALTLTLIQGSVLTILGGVGQAQWALLNTPGSALPGALSATAFLTSYPLLMLGPLTFALRGRLGGTVTGWAWTGRGMHDGAAATGA